MLATVNLTACKLDAHEKGPELGRALVLTKKKANAVHMVGPRLLPRPWTTARPPRTSSGPLSGKSDFGGVQECMVEML